MAKAARPLGPGRPRKNKGGEVLSETLGFRTTKSLKERFSQCLKAYGKQQGFTHGGDLFREFIDEGLKKRGF